MQKRMHSREFKLEVVRQIASGQKRPAQTCREYGLADSVLSRWRKELFFIIQPWLSPILSEPACFASNR